MGVETVVHHLGSLSVAATSVTALVFGAVLVAASLALLKLLNRAFAERPEAVPLPAFIGTVTTAWALALGFAAADIWSVNARAEQIAAQERSSLGRLAGMTTIDALNAPALLDALQRYATASTEHEWRANANSVPAAQVDAAVEAIRLEIVKAARADVPATLIAKMVNDFDELQDARNARLGLGARSISDFKWYLVLFLTGLSVVTIAVLHADRPEAGRNAIVIFACASTVSLWILLLHANPYTGIEGIKPEEVNSAPFAVSSARLPDPGG